MSVFGSVIPSRLSPRSEALPTSLARAALLAHTAHDVQVDAAREKVGPRIVERPPFAGKEAGFQAEQHIAALDLQPAGDFGGGRQGADLGARYVRIHLAGPQQQVQYRAGESIGQDSLRREGLGREVDQEGYRPAAPG